MWVVQGSSDDCYLEKEIRAGMIHKEVCVKLPFPGRIWATDRHCVKSATWIITSAGEDIAGVVNI